MTQLEGLVRNNWLKVLLLLLLPLVPGPLAAEEGLSPLPRQIPRIGLSLSSNEGDFPIPPCGAFELSLVVNSSAHCTWFALQRQTPPDPSPADSPSEEPNHEVAKQPPNDLATYLVSAGVLAGSAAFSATDSPHESFHFSQEGFFGQSTSYGGADKASHFVDYYILSKELAFFYEKLDHPRDRSILMGLGVSLAAGLVQEFSNGFTFYGFSYEDLIMDTFGAGSAATIAALEAQDLVGFRRGFLINTSGKSTCCQVDGRGRDYSNEIFTADLKLAGLAHRLDFEPGPLRYLLFSATYGTKGYPTGAPELRERQVGFEIGLNLEEILNAIGVRRDRWWGYGLHLVFDNIRVPFTSVGFYLDLNSGQWTGPNNGNGFAQ